MPNLPVLRASEMDRVLRCPGSRVLNARVKKLEREDGHAGTWLHWKIADRLIKEFGAIPPDGGLPPPNVPEGYKPNPVDLWIVDWAIRHIRNTIPEGWALFVELELIYAFEKWIGAGHIDVFAINKEGTEAIGVDWKTGRDPVPPADMNNQILTYLILARRAWPSLQRIRFDIGQPRANEEHGFERLSSVNVPPLDSPYGDDLLTVCMMDLDRRASAAVENWRRVSSGRVQCKWCDAPLACPAIEMDLDFMEAELTQELLDTLRETPDDAKLADFVLTAKTIQKAIKDAETMLKERCRAKGTVFAKDGTRVSVQIQGGAYKLINPSGADVAVRSLIPPDRVPFVVNYSMERLVDEIAAANAIPKGGNEDMTAKKLLASVVQPNFEQGERVLFNFST